MALITFDLDDTLYKERDFVSSGYRAVSRYFKEKYNLDETEMFRSMLTAPFNAFDSLEEYLINRGVQKDISITEKIHDMVAIYREHMPDISLEEKVIATFEELKNRGHRLALITDGRTVTQSNKIKALGLEKFIESSLISISQEIGAEKYRPLAFERMMRLVPDVEEYFYVGDNPMKDFVWPNRLGWRTVMLIDNGRNVHPQQINVPSADYQAEIKISEFEELLDVIS